MIFLAAIEDRQLQFLVKQNLNVLKIINKIVIKLVVKLLEYRILFKGILLILNYRDDLLLTMSYDLVLQQSYE